MANNLTMTVRDADAVKAVAMFSQVRGYKREATGTKHVIRGISGTFFWNAKGTKKTTWITLCAR